MRDLVSARAGTPVSPASVLISGAFAFYPFFTGLELLDMSTYEIGAFEALEWAWNVLRTENSGDKEEAATLIQEMLFKLGSGTQVDFKLA